MPLKLLTMRNIIFMTLIVVSLSSCGQGNKTSATAAKADVKGLSRTTQTIPV
jgi:uncharacterized lipoprotein YehR (DUF1307 family)